MAHLECLNRNGTVSVEPHKLVVTALEVLHQSNIQRMREDSERTARNMQVRAEMEMLGSTGFRLAQRKKTKIARRRMEEKNYQIDVRDAEIKQLKVLRLKAQQESRSKLL